jgi:plasmid stabilization system protein ParE
MHVELRDEAQTDLDHGYEFYGRQGGELGEYFLKCLQADVVKLEYQAGSHAIARGFHIKKSAKFPYVIYYRVVGEVVDVVAILDGRMDPGKIAERLDSSI